jgi:hypothetical protein
MDQGMKEDVGGDDSRMEIDVDGASPEYDLPLTQSPLPFRPPPPPSPEPALALEPATAHDEGVVGGVPVEEAPLIVDGINVDMRGFLQSDINHNVTESSFPLPIPEQLLFNDPYIRTLTALRLVQSGHPPHSPINTDVLRAALGPPMEFPYFERLPPQSPNLSDVMDNLVPQSPQSPDLSDVMDNLVPQSPHSPDQSGYIDNLVPPSQSPDISDFMVNLQCDESIPPSPASSTTETLSNPEAPTPPSSIYSSSTTITASEGPTRSPSPQTEPVVPDAQIDAQINAQFNAQINAQAEAHFDAQINDQIYALVEADLVAHIYALVDAIIFGN